MKIDKRKYCFINSKKYKKENNSLIMVKQTHAGIQMPVLFFFYLFIQFLFLRLLFESNRRHCSSDIYYIYAKYYNYTSITCLGYEIIRITNYINTIHIRRQEINAKRQLEKQNGSKKQIKKRKNFLPLRFLFKLNRSNFFLLAGSFYLKLKTAGNILKSKIRLLYVSIKLLIELNLNY